MHATPVCAKTVYLKCKREREHPEQARAVCNSIDSGGGADTRFEFHIAGSVSSDLPSLHPGRYSVLQYYILVRGGD